MDLSLYLNDDIRDWQRKVGAFADEHLIPYEVEAELGGGVLPKKVTERHNKIAFELGLSRMDSPKEHGGLALDQKTQVAIWEQLGRVTNALCWCFAEAYDWMFQNCTPAQLEKYIKPLMNNETHVAYAITEAGPGSDAAGIKATAHFENGVYRLNGEKWFVTDANLSDFLIVQALVVGGESDGEHSFFFVPIDADGLEVIDNPPFAHTFAAHHPTYAFRDVMVPADERIGKAGDNLTYTYSWFRRERLMIAARCCGAAARLIEEMQEFARTRELPDGRLLDKDWVKFAIADATTDLYAARLMAFDTAHAIDSGMGLKVQHGRCSMAKLFASEMVNRTADVAVQIFGGRGYMRTTAAERFYREVRVDRIWEGTSEIQRLIIARRVEKDGLSGL